MVKAVLLDLMMVNWLDFGLVCLLACKLAIWMESSLDLYWDLLKVDWLALASAD